MGFKDLAGSRVFRLNGRDIVLKAEPVPATRRDIEKIPVLSKQVSDFDDLPRLFGEYGAT